MASRQQELPLATSPPELKGPQPPVPGTTPHTQDVVLDLLRTRPVHRVLDAPCGQGSLAWTLVQHGMEPFCLDRDPEVFLLQGVDFRVADLSEPLQFPDGSFDAVACLDGLEQLENPFHAVREFCRVLRRGGPLVLSTPNINAMPSRLRFLLTGGHSKFKRPLNEADPLPRQPFTPLTYPWLRYMLHTSGFRITTVRANRIKPFAYLNALLWPLAALATALSFAGERDPEQRRRNRQILTTLLSPAVFFGETLIIAAEKN